MSTTIAIIEDDLNLAKLMRAFLVKQGFSVLIEHRGDRAIYRIIKMQPQLVILDIFLPKIDGLTVCREIRQYYDGPVIMLTAKEGDETEIRGLCNGADAYLRKPIDPPVLLAHIQALLRRSMQALKPIRLEIGALRIDPSNQEVHWQNQYIPLSHKEFELLYFLANHEGKIVSRDNITQALRGFDYDGLNRNIDMTISTLRKKLQDEKGHRIKTVWGKGYLFVVEAW